ncbi:hypothetical protein LXL04_033099 [Taraxacum kok-saghyz]
MTSSSSTGSVNRGARQGVRRRCDCGDLVGMWTAWTARTPGRRFVGCPNYKDENQDCGYFDWIDPQLPNNWYREQLLALHNLRNGQQNIVQEVGRGMCNTPKFQPFLKLLKHL